MTEDEPLILADLDLADGFWVFGYGSLIWNPGFQAEETVLARLDGYHRSFCMASIHYRGTPQVPVLALDATAGAACEGVAYRVARDVAGDVLEYLRARELISAAYREVVSTLRLRDGRLVPALAYVIDRDHVQYRGALSLRDQASIIAAAQGTAGPNREYLHSTVASLRQLGLVDPDLFALADMVGDGG